VDLAVQRAVEILCCSGSADILRKDVQGCDGSGGSSIFSKSHAISSSSNIFGRDSSRIIGSFGSLGGSILIQLHGCGGSEGKEGKMMEEAVLVDVCERLGRITDSEDALREVWRQITGTGTAKSHNVMHMQHKHGSDNQLAAALFVWLEQEFVDVAGENMYDMNIGVTLATTFGSIIIWNCLVFIPLSL
jgi:hypothetical protein